MRRLPLAIIFGVLWCIMQRAEAEELERRVTYPEKEGAVSLNLKKGGPVVEAMVNGQPARFMVRPEVNFSQIDNASAKRLGLKPVEGYDSVVLASSLSLGGAEIRNEPWLVENWKPDSRKLDGVIGHSTLREFVVRLNYPDDELTLMKPGSLPPATGVEGVMEMIVREEDITLSGTKVSARRGGFTVRATARGGVMVPLKIESMRQRKPSLPESIVKEKLPGLSAKPGALIQPEMKLGHPSLGGMEFRVTAKGYEGLPDDAGVLTAQILIHLNVTLDYPGRRVRVAVKAAPHFTVPGAEFIIHPDDKGDWRVTEVKEKSPAQGAGLEKGDLLLSVAGVPCSKVPAGEVDILKWNERRVIFARGSEGERKEIEVKWTKEDERTEDPLLGGLLREWTFPEGRDAVEIPMKMFGSSPVVEVKVNGQTLRCTLDTGASTSVLTLEAAERAGLKREQADQARSISNERIMAFKAVAETVEIGGLTIRREPWGVTAFPESSETGRVDGVLGLGTLRDFVMRMDWKAKKVTLWKRGKEPAPEGGFAVPVKVEEWAQSSPPSPAPQHFRPASCHMMINAGGQTIPCTMDTGSDGGLDLPGALVREKLPEVAATAGPLLESGMGLTGVVMVRRIRVPEFTLGNETLKDLPADLGDMSHGNVGMKILRHFTITLDADGGRLHFLPYGTLNEVTAGSTLGFTTVYRDKHVVVGTVIPGGPAEPAGIKAGDVFVSVNGRSVLDEKEREWTEKPRPPGTAVKVKMIRGGVEMEFTVVSAKP